jgi:hypothetical protein
MAQRGARPSIPFPRHPVLIGMGLSAAYDERKQPGRNTRINRINGSATLALAT